MMSRAISILSPTVVIDVCQGCEALSLTSQGEHLTIFRGQSSVRPYLSSSESSMDSKLPSYGLDA